MLIHTEPPAYSHKQTHTTTTTSISTSHVQKYKGTHTHTFIPIRSDEYVDVQALAHMYTQESTQADHHGLMCHSGALRPNAKLLKPVFICYKQPVHQQYRCFCFS